MLILRRGRFFLRLARELSYKYKAAVLLGFLLGLTGSLALARLSPHLVSRWSRPVERIGVVGIFTPSTLPYAVQQLISFGLTTVGADGNAGPGLAANWEATESGRTYTFHLRPDLRWHNGKLVEARHVNYNIRDVTFSVIDTLTLRATLRESYSPFPTLVAKPIFQAGLIGFGPYKVESIKLKGESVVYLKLDPVTPGDRRKEYRFYRTEAQAITAYKLGEVDTLEDLTNAQELTFWGRTGIEEGVRHDRIVSLFFNLNDARLSEKSARQALSYAIPEFSYEKALSPISKNSWAYTESVRRYDFDENQVKKLLKNSAAATSSGQLTLTTFSPYVATAEKIAKSWSSFGIPTIVKVANELTNDYQILLSAQSVPPDPDQYPFWHSTQKTTNITGYVNVKIDKLLEDGRRELDLNKRKKIYAEFARRLVEDDPATFLYYPKTYTVRRGK